MAGLSAQQDKDLLQRVLGLGRRNGCGPGRIAEGMGDIGHELGGHLGRRKLVIHQARGNGAAWHAVVFGGCGVLGHDHAALALDGPHAQGAVAAGARKHDADGPLVLVLGKGAEEKIDRQALAAGGGRFQQLERAVQKGHVTAGRDDVGAVGLHHHSVLDLKDLHAGIAPDEVGEDALVVRGQMLHQDKGHARIDVGRHAGKKGFEGRQPTGRCADADNGKTGRGGFIRLRCPGCVSVNLLCFIFFRRRRFRCDYLVFFRDAIMDSCLSEALHCSTLLSLSCSSSGCRSFIIFHESSRFSIIIPN